MFRGQGFHKRRQNGIAGGNGGVNAQDAARAFAPGSKPVEKIILAEDAFPGEFAEEISFFGKLNPPGVALKKSHALFFLEPGYEPAQRRWTQCCP